MAIDNIDTSLCIGCGTCVRNCPMDVFRLDDSKGKSTIKYPKDCQCEWLAWVKLKQGPDGTMTLSKQPVPDAWKPNPLIPYEQRYPNRFPGELEFLGRQSCE